MSRKTAPAEDFVDGIILVDKPTGCTSHDVVYTVRKHFNLRKTGHCGTLDPEASGLLILLLGKGTKLSELLMGEDKTYEGSFK
ncbi:MAG: tRNA pseudouridine(55) synthase, partial [Verrucomicrobia bacterium]|nr:tRNA pseudouridine(55) synthase [Verrucomicrobiota bacterium]